MDIRVTNIEWDTDGEEVDLPDELVIDTDAEGVENPEQELADLLSDRFGWSVKGFSFEPVSDLEQTPPRV